LPAAVVPIEVTDVARDRSWPLLDKLFQETRNKISSCLVLLPIATVYVRYANILLYDCPLKVVYYLKTRLLDYQDTLVIT
jgi:hypothetical protein